MVLKKGRKKEPAVLFKEIIKIVRKEIGPVACLYNFSIISKLPKTRSGKILRRTVRKILDKEKWSMPATIEDPTAIEEVLKVVESVLIKRQAEKIFETLEQVDSKKVKME